MIKLMQCPGCGEVVRFDDTKVSSFCMSCGQKIYKDTKQGNNNRQGEAKPNPNPNPVQNIPQGSNLIISYISEHPRVNLIITFISTGFKDQYTNGVTKAYKLIPGIHAINFQIGKRTYRREVFIYPDSEPVRVQASWSKGVAHIAIMNPQGGNLQTLQQ